MIYDHKIFPFECRTIVIKDMCQDLGPIKSQGPGARQYAGYQELIEFECSLLKTS